MTQTVAALALVIGLAVAVVAAAGYMLVNDTDHDLTNLLVGGILTQFGVGASVIFKKIGGS